MFISRLVFLAARLEIFSWRFSFFPPRNASVFFFHRSARLAIIFSPPPAFLNLRRRSRELRELFSMSAPGTLQIIPTLRAVPRQE
jgi:hypothetical protein